MTKTKARLYLMTMIVIAIMVGAVYYIYYVDKETIITKGTLVENSMEDYGGDRECIYQDRT